LAGIILITVANYNI